MALKCAQEDYRNNHDGQDFDPTNLTNNKAFDEFAESFRKYIIAFAKPNLQASRGMDSDAVPEIKTKGSPVFGLFATQEQLQGHVKMV